MIHYEKFEKSLRRLQNQSLYYQQLDEELPINLHEAVIESVVQRFETCYDTLWKVLRRYLIEELVLTDSPSSPKPIFRLANENDLLASSVEKWFEYSQARIDTSHDYDGDKARACLALVPDFVDDAIALYMTMTGKTWE